jgi:RNA polymerase sigma-70 factor (ECF subfamily)
MPIACALPDVSRPLGILASESSDEALIQRIADGDERALRVLFARHNVRIYRFALRLTENPSTAEDVVNDVFFDVWRQAAAFQASSRVSTWLLAITRHKAISAIRHRSEAQWDEDLASNIADAADDPEDSMHVQNRSAVVQHCLARLSPAQREVIDLAYYHEKSIAEVATIVKAPEATVKTRMFYARKRLSELLVARGIQTARW